jgi:hypothetical protein
MIATRIERNSRSKRNVGNEGPSKNLDRVGTGQDSSHDVGQKRERQPAEHVSDEGVGAPDLQRQHEETDGNDDERDRQRDEEVDRRRHATEVGRRLDGVPQHHPDQGRVEHPAGHVIPDDLEQTTPGHLAQLGREVNDREHHREGQRRGPQHRGPELGAGAGIGTDSGTVVVRRTRDQAEPQGPQPLARLFPGEESSASPRLFARGKPCSASMCSGSAMSWLRPQ